MRYSEISNMLEQQFVIDFQNNFSDIEITDLFLLDSSSAKYSDNAIYFGHLSQFAEMATLPLNILYWDTLSAPMSFQNSNYIHISQKDFPAIFNLLKQELMDELRSKNEYSDMLKMILDGKSLSAILDTAAQNVKNAFVVLDVSGKLLAHSSPFDVKDPLWIHSVADGYCSYEFMNHIKQLRMKKESRATSEAFISVCEENQMTYLCSNILSDNILLGYVFMFENNVPIEKRSHEIIRAISRVASELITRSQDSSDLRTNLYHSIMLDMLGGIDPEHANVRIQVSELNFPERMCVLNVRPSFYRGKSYLKEILEQILKVLPFNTPSIHYREAIVLIIPLNETQQIKSDLLEILTGIARKEHLQIGISNGFTQIPYFADYYAQAEFALHSAIHMDIDGNLFYYKDYAFRDLLTALPNDLKLRHYCHSALGLLRKYDIENKTPFYQTLKIYTETGLNQHLTAERLFIHRNTLNYRIHRIEKITGIDFKDPKLLFQLQYSFELDEFINDHYDYS